MIYFDPSPAMVGVNVGELAAADCVLFVWAPPERLKSVLGLIDEWDFTYRSALLWRKAEPTPVRTGEGPVLSGGDGWFRGGCENLLVATRGRPVAPAPGTQVPSVINAVPLTGGRKPDRFAEIVESYFPTLPKIALLNDWQPRLGWDHAGPVSPAGLSAYVEGRLSAIRNERDRLTLRLAELAEREEYLQQALVGRGVRGPVARGAQGRRRG